VTSQSRTKPPIAGALVDCGAGLSATTDASGSYVIANVPAGGYTCRASASGYRSKSQSVTVGSGQTARLDFSLRKA
jgi:carboxypeptidase family protein